MGAEEDHTLPLQHFATHRLLSVFLVVGVLPAWISVYLADHIEYKSPDNGFLQVLISSHLDVTCVQNAAPSSLLFVSDCS